MPAIRDLRGCRQRDVDRLGVGPGPVPGDDLDRGVRTHPRGHRSSFPAGEHFDRLTSLQVDDDRSVLVTARDRPVIDADDPRSWFALALRSSAQLPQHGVGTGAQAQDVSKPGCRLTTKGMAQRVQRPSLRLRTTLMPTGQGVDALGKRTTRAAGACTLEATHLNGENDPLLEHRSFFQPAHIAAVASVTPTMAGRTRCRANRTAGFDSNGLPSRVAGDEALTHAGKDTIDPTENLAHGNDQRKARSARNQAPNAAVTQSAGDP
ncbi:hypothetical protein CNECB9_3760097 [Cupriavidus necator]|uniref:Uncharacterized protein n=1 Tax=Cupriavidus necator TaxID=106590 RepID=A0A1K0IIX2_CUPNE|nr:hypothetical protein CNECB9_3760097 [Cupriavidus necator]